jgi:hypothetical protein
MQELEQEPKPKVTDKMLDDFTQRIAYKLAGDYGLRDNDFVIKFWPSKKFDYAIKAGGVIRVYFTHTPKYTDYETMLRRCLQHVALFKKNKRTSVVVYGVQKDMMDSIKAEFKEWQELPPLLPYEQIIVRTEYKVSLTDRATGLTVTKEGKIGRKGVTVTRLMINARMELSDLAGALAKVKELATATKESVGTHEAPVKSE